MPGYDPLDADADPFGPPAIPTLVGCLHCGEEYESYRIEWRVLRDSEGRPHGFWCCPIPGCDGKGFGCDIFPVDPTYRDERGGWVYDDEEEPDEAEGGSDAEGAGPSAPDRTAERGDESGGDEEALPW